MPALPLPEEKKRFVREKFTAISPRYDLLNSLLSLRIDHYWRKQVAWRLRQIPAGFLLDLCAGTLPLALELARQIPERQILAIDFCQDMLKEGIKALPKDARDTRPNRINPVCGDGEALPVASSTCSGCTIAFGIRNLAHADQGLSEAYRVLKPGGRLIILEFSRPTNPLIKPLYHAYLHQLLPLVAGRISGNRDAYRYLADSIAAFYEPETLLAMMRQAGFADVCRVPLSCGIASLYLGDKNE